MSHFWRRTGSPLFGCLALVLFATADAQQVMSGATSPPNTKIQQLDTSVVPSAASRFGDYDSESVLMARRRSLMDAAQNIDRRAHPDAWALSPYFGA